MAVAAAASGEPNPSPNERSQSIIIAFKHPRTAATSCSPLLAPVPSQPDLTRSRVATPSPLQWPPSHDLGSAYLHVYASLVVVLHIHAGMTRPCGYAHPTTLKAYSNALA